MGGWTEVDRYLGELFAPPDPVLDAALAASAAAGLPAHHVAPTQGKLLQLLARLQGARSILEIGTLGGYSTIWLARALPPGGRLVTLEADPRHAEVARANLDRAGLGGVVEVFVGPALETLPRLADEGRGPFDLVFLDADKPSNPDYLDWALRLTRRGSLIVADNVVRDGEVVDAGSRDPRVQGVRRFLERLAAEPRLGATAIQTVGSKGWDGLAIARRGPDAASRTPRGWAAFESAAPELAAAARRLLIGPDGVALGFLATASPSGTPRLGPVCPIFCGDELYLCAAAGTPKRRDLRNGGAFVLHAPLGADDEELQVAGRADEVADAAERAAVHEAIPFGSFGRRDPVFRLGIERALWVHWERVGQPDTRAVRRRWPSREE